jgi:hypothetical protein
LVSSLLTDYLIKSALLRHITRFLMEMGAGFAFVGRQFHLEVEGDEFFIDLLFYHTRLKCYVVVELKATAFKPEHAGQLNFYRAGINSSGTRQAPAVRNSVPPAPCPCQASLPRPFQRYLPCRIFSTQPMRTRTLTQCLALS